MKINVLYYLRLLLFFLLMSEISNAQTLNRKLHSEADGYQWYSVWSTESNIIGIQNSDGKNLFYIEDDTHDYSYYYTNFNGKSNKAFFCVGRTNKKIIPKKRKDRKNYKYEVGRCQSIIDLDGNVIIPFERGYEIITYIETDGKCYFKVNKGYEKEGICDIHGREIVEPKYESVYYHADGFHAILRYNDPEYSYSNRYKALGILLNENSEIDSHALNKSLFTDEESNFSYYVTFQDGIYGITDVSGRDLIPRSKGCTLIQFRNINGKVGYFYCNKGNIIGAYNSKGEEIIPFSLGCNSLYYNKKYGIFNVEKDDIDGIYGFDGKEIIPLSCGFDLVIYDYDNKGFIKCYKKHKEGAYTLEGERIIKPEYSTLYYTKEGFKGSKNGENEIFLGILLPNHDKLYPKPKPTIQRKIVETKKTDSKTADNNFGTDTEHGKILNRKVEKDASGTVTQTEWYEDGYVSTVVMKKCASCGGTGKSFNGFCLNCTGGFIISRKTINPKTGDSNTYTSGSTGGNTVGTGTYSGSSNKSSKGSGSSTYTKCTSCNGSGKCSSCNGRGYKFNSYSGHDDSCPSCKGKGSCPICYGRGKL